MSTDRIMTIFVILGLNLIVYQFASSKISKKEKEFLNYLQPPEQIYQHFKAQISGECKLVERVAGVENLPVFEHWQCNNKKVIWARDEKSISFSENYFEIGN